MNIIVIIIHNIIITIINISTSCGDVR